MDRRSPEKDTVIINSKCPEFEYELVSVLPYAYTLYLQGRLKETVSALDTSCLYFFSPKHTEVATKRSWNNVQQLQNSGIPNSKIHTPALDWNYFTPPPLKDYYENEKISFDKEIFSFS